MDKAQLELQLKVWKDLAISKQMLMRTASDALKLDPTCTAEELKQALDDVIRKIAKADADVIQAQEQAKQAIAATEKKLTVAEKTLLAAQTTVAELQAAQDNTTRQIGIERGTRTKDLQKAKELLAEKEKALKAINTALADTPENVIKKMNLLKKQKQDEADARRQVEAALNTLRTEKRKQDQLVTDAQKGSAKLITEYRDLHALCTKLHEQLKPLVDEKDLPKLPDLNSELIEEVENPGVEKDQDKDKDRDKSRDKERTRKAG